VVPVTLSVLDTSVLIAERAAPIEGDLGISVVSVAELQFGVLVAPDDERRAHRLARLSAILRGFEPLPVDSAVAASYGELAAATHRAGRKATARSLDLMIAATAHAHGARLVTANLGDVQHLSGLIDIVAATPGS
jgi:predicted nucleic acid-binding protein